MRRISSGVIISLLCLLAGIFEFPGSSVQAYNKDVVIEDANKENEGYVAGEAVVIIKSKDSDNKLTKMGKYPANKQISIEECCEFEVNGEDNIYVTKLHSSRYTTSQLLNQVKKEQGVISVSPNYLIETAALTKDKYSQCQWYLSGQKDFFSSSNHGINYGATRQYATSRTPIVAVVDTGVDYNHEDLKNRMWHNPYTSKGLKGTYGYDFGDGDGDPMDQQGHGTHCAGIIGAVSNNNLGIAGVVDNVRIMALKIFNSNSEGDTYSAVQAFNYIYKAQSYGANIVAVNCSWGKGKASSALKTIINKIGQRGAVFCFAAGNDGKNCNSMTTTPFDIDSKYLIRVGATNAKEERASYSNYGSKTVEIFAPGDRIFSTYTEKHWYPGLMDEETRSNTTQFWDTCSTTSKSLIPASMVQSKINSVYSIQNSQYDMQGNTSSGSILMRCSMAWGEEAVAYLDVTDIVKDPTKVRIASYDIAQKYAYGGYDPNYQRYDVSGEMITQAVDADEDNCDIHSKDSLEEKEYLNWVHKTISVKPTDYVLKNGRRYLKIFASEVLFQRALDPNNAGRVVNATIYIDNIALSGTNPASSLLEKYALCDGTSMASPVVAGAVALLANAYPKDDALMRKSRLMHCARKINSLSNYSITGGILDLSKIKNAQYTPVKISKIKLNHKKAALKRNKSLKLVAQILPGSAWNTKLIWKSSNKKYATVTKSGKVKAKKKGVGHKVRIIASAKDGSGEKAVCTVMIK